MPKAGAVVGVYVRGEPHLLEIDFRGSVTHHANGFFSMGSARNFAEHAGAVFRGLRAEPLTLYQAKLLAYRIVQDPIEIAGPNAAISKPIQMATLTADGASVRASLLAEDEPETRDAVDNWMAMEALRFREHAPPDWGFPTNWTPP